MYSQQIAVAVLIVVVLLLLFTTYLDGPKKWVLVNLGLEKENMEDIIDKQTIEELRKDRVSSDGSKVSVGGPLTSDILQNEGYAADGFTWDEYIKADDLDPSAFDSQAEFVKDVKRFSSGANFTSTADDNTSPIFTNFIGLRRPEHVPIGSSARQVPDIDVKDLQRTKAFRW